MTDHISSYQDFTETKARPASRHIASIEESERNERIRSHFSEIDREPQTPLAKDSSALEMKRDPDLPGMLLRASARFIGAAKKALIQIFLEDCDVMTTSNEVEIVSHAGWIATRGNGQPYQE